MSETEVVQRTDRPHTRSSLAADLRRIGLAAGDVVIVHSSLSAIGWVAGGPVAVLLALQDVLTPDGTLIVPTHTSDRTDPAGWQHPPVPSDWFTTIRDDTPGFDPALTPTRRMGVIAETFRSWPGVRRSRHPHVSFAAWGRHGDAVTRDHELAWSLGEGSPLARAYDLGASTLLLGTRNCTSLHLAEARSGRAGRCVQGAAVLTDGGSRWVTFDDWDYDTEGFDEVLVSFCRQEGITPLRVGDGDSLLLDQRALVDHATQAFRGE
ncbi:MAG TPA: AAC(3) family N-acetyltransferase [Microlunatus sp.]|jgi:aminoglycoside 3-N-acetyltransferase